MASTNQSGAKFKTWQTVLIALLLLVPPISALYLICILVILIHEAGHLMGGMACGLEFASIRVGPLLLTSAKTFSWEWRTNTIWNGATRMNCTTRAERMVVFRYFVFVSAGVVANLAFAVAAFAVAKGESSVAAFFKVFIAISLLSSAVNLTPFRSRLQTSDGYFLCTLLFRGRLGSQPVAAIIWKTRFDERVMKLMKEQRVDEALENAEALALEWQTNTGTEISDEMKIALKNLQAVIERWNAATARPAPSAETRDGPPSSDLPTASEGSR